MAARIESNLQTRLPSNLLSSAEHHDPFRIHFQLPSTFLDTRAQRDGFVLLAAFLLSFLLSAPALG